MGRSTSVSSVIRKGCLTEAQVRAAQLDKPHTLTLLHHLQRIKQILSRATAAKCKSPAAAAMLQREAREQHARMTVVFYMQVKARDTAGFQRDEDDPDDDGMETRIHEVVDASLYSPSSSGAGSDSQWSWTNSEKLEEIDECVAALLGREDERNGFYGGNTNGHSKHLPSKGEPRTNGDCPRGRTLERWNYQIVQELHSRARSEEAKTVMYRNTDVDPLQREIWTEQMAMPVDVWKQRARKHWPCLPGETSVMELLRVKENPYVPLEPLELVAGPQQCTAGDLANCDCLACEKIGT